MTGGRRRLALLLGTLAVAAACGSDSPSGPASASEYTAAYDSVWQTFDRTYSYFVLKGIDWPAERERHRAEAANVRSDDALAQVINALVTPLRDAHVHLSRPDGSVVSSYVPLGTINWVRSSWDASVSAMSAGRQGTGWRAARVTTTGGDVGYLALTTWATGQISADDVDGALETLRDTRALVLDVRMNGGGNDAIAFAVAGRFTTRTIAFGTVQTRSGPAHTDFAAPETRTIAPRGTWQYTKPVYLLVGRGVFSSAESFAAALGEMPQVTVAGDTTGGSSGNPREFALRVGNRDTGWRYTVSTWVETLANGRLIEGFGIAPDVVVPFAFNPAQPTNADPVIAWAISQARTAPASDRIDR